VRQTTLSRFPVRIPTEWPYWAGGVAIAAVNTAILALLGRPWGITGPITNLGGRMLQRLGLRPETWAYFQAGGIEQAFREFDMWNGMLWLNFGIIAGVVLSGLFADELRLRTGRRTWKTVGLAAGGGFLIGYGTRLSAGCNAGALLGGIPSFSLHGWVFAIVVFLGVVIGLRLFRQSL
jgi:hypothetical protein